MKRFLEFLTRPTTIGVTVGITLFAFFIAIQGPASCRDGWHSPSIGRRGACSHHGGVASSPLLFELMLSILAGWAAGVLRNRPLERRRERRRLAERRAAHERIEAEIKAKAQADGIACPLCGFPLRMRRMGKSKRGYFMGCTRYPVCTGWRPASQAERDEALARRIQ